MTANVVSCSGFTPYVGNRWMKPVCFGALAQHGSSSAPSIWIAHVRRVACARTAFGTTSCAPAIAVVAITIVKARRMRRSRSALTTRGGQPSLPPGCHRYFPSNMRRPATGPYLGFHQARRAIGVELVANTRVLEEQLRDRELHFVAPADRARRELELTDVPVEQLHHTLLRDAVSRRGFDLEDSTLRYEQPRDLVLADEQEDSRFALELEQREQRA